MQQPSPSVRVWPPTERVCEDWSVDKASFGAETCSGCCLRSSQWPSQSHLCFARTLQQQATGTLQSKTCSSAGRQHGNASCWQLGGCFLRDPRRVFPSPAWLRQLGLRRVHLQQQRRVVQVTAPAAAGGEQRPGGFLAEGLGHHRCLPTGQQVTVASLFSFAVCNTFCLLQHQ